MKNFKVTYIEEKEPNALTKSIVDLFESEVVWEGDEEIIDIKYITYFSPSGTLRFGAFIHYRI